ncbi:MAG: putative metal-binding motif-containing protein [Deltaproteobacteria bacterium]|nr:putative metal-binding motif-containing protein [Deltaproteobacteria bacterium]
MKQPLIVNMLFATLAGLSFACGHAKNNGVKLEKKISKPATEKRSEVVKYHATTVEAFCKPGEKERCNALDDDCDGAIDEGCGYQSGLLQITLGWDSGADIDLYVTDPTGETLCFRKNERDSPSGGHMDIDSRGDCRKQQKVNRVENIFWTGSSPPKGNYQVELHYFSPCGLNQETNATVSISVSGRILGVFKRRLNPEERIHLLTFSLY